MKSIIFCFIAMLFIGSTASAQKKDSVSPSKHQTRKTKMPSSIMQPVPGASNAKADEGGSNIGGRSVGGISAHKEGGSNIGGRTANVEKAGGTGTHDKKEGGGSGVGNGKQDSGEKGNGKHEKGNGITGVEGGRPDSK